MTLSASLPEQTIPVYCTDEDILVRAGGDFIMLCPPWQQMAAGTDGVFAPGTPWVLNSASVNFAANGVSPNQVAWLTAPATHQRAGANSLRLTASPGIPSRSVGRTRTSSSVSRRPRRPA